jgi:hypothetical protein
MHQLQNTFTILQRVAVILAISPISLRAIVFIGKCYPKKMKAVKKLICTGVFSKQKGSTEVEPFVVPRTGIEPAHPCERQILSLLRLPIPPPGQ